MSTNLYIQKNPFSQNIEKQTVSDGRISDIIRKIDARTASNTGWRVMLNDEIITDFERVTRDGDSLYVKLIPEGDSPKDVAVAEKWSGAGLMALGGLLTAFTGGIGVTVGGILISAGLSVFANGVIGYNTQPGSKKKRERAEQDPSIRGAHNQARPLENIPILLGKRRIYPDPAANPYTWVDKDGSQYLYQLFCCGQKDQVIDLSTVRIGETLLKDLSGTGDMAKITGGEDPLIQLSAAYGESQPPLMQKCVHEDQLNQQLVHQTEDKTPGDIIHTTPDNTDTINVDIFFPQGLGKYEDDNSLSSVSVVIKAFYKQASEPDSAYTVLGSFAVDDKISAKELKTKRYSVEKAGLAPDAYTVKIVRETADSKDNGTIDTCYVGSVRAIKSVSPVSAERCRQITLIGLKIKASEKLSNYIDQLNFVSQSKLPVYSDTSSGPSSWNGTALSSNPASAAMYAMRGDVVQQKLADTDIDWISFRELFQWCTEHGYECNAYITDSMPISELLANIGSTCRAEISRQNGKIRVIHDIVRSGFVQLFTPRNSSNYSESILFADIPDELVLSFPDEKSGYAENELKVYNTPDGNRRQIPDTSQDMPLWGVTSDVQARKLGMFNLAVSRARPIVHTFNADFEYMLCQKGDWIKYAGDIALAGIAQGRIVSLITDRGILIGAVTDEAITTVPGKTYGVRIRRSDGTCILEEIVTTGGTGNQFDFVRPIPADYAEPGNLFTFGEYDRDSIDLIVTDIRCGDDLTAEITAVGYAPEIFAVDEPDFVLPDYTNQLSEFASAVDAGTIESAMSASTSALNARISEIRASKSATSASASATTAGAKASEASTSATSASESATSAKTSESNAATSAANAKKDADFVRDFDANWDERVSNTKVNGHTLIEGGYINTDIIEADSIDASKIKTGTITTEQLNFGSGNNIIGGGLDTFDQWDTVYYVDKDQSVTVNFNNDHVLYGTSSIAVQGVGSVTLGNADYQPIIPRGNYILSCYVQGSRNGSAEITLTAVGAVTTKGVTIYAPDDRWHRIFIYIDSNDFTSDGLIFPKITINKYSSRFFLDGFMLENGTENQDPSNFSPCATKFLNGRNILSRSIEKEQINLNTLTFDNSRLTYPSRSNVIDGGLDDLNVFPDIISDLGLKTNTVSAPLTTAAVPFAQNRYSLSLDQGRANGDEIRFGNKKMIDAGLYKGVSRKFNYILSCYVKINRIASYNNSSPFVKATLTCLAYNRDFEGYDLVSDISDDCVLLLKDFEWHRVCCIIRRTQSSDRIFLVPSIFFQNQDGIKTSLSFNGFMLEELDDDVLAENPLPTPSPFKFVGKNELDGRNISPETITPEQLDLKALNQMILDFIYPVGAIAIFWNNFNPNSKFGGTWVKIASGKFLEQSDSDANLGTAVAAGLPNIIAAIDNSGGTYGVVGFDGNCTSGAFSGSNKGNTHWGSSGGNSIKKLQFNAANGETKTNGTLKNDVYGKSNTVQPSSVKVNMWRRTA